MQAYPDETSRFARGRMSRGAPLGRPALVTHESEEEDRPSAGRRFVRAAAWKALGAGLGLALAACAARPSAKGPADEPPPRTVEEALAQVDRAEGDIERLLGAAPQPSPTFAQPPGQVPAAEPLARAPAPRAPARAEDESPRDAATPVSSNPCDTACRALASMRRATEHVCGLAGEGDGRCTSARARVRAAGERVRAQCPSCPEG